MIGESSRNEETDSSFSVIDKFQIVAYVFQIVVAILAYVFNCILILIVIRSRNKEIGRYSILIVFFALSDIYYNTVHFVVFPVIEYFHYRNGNHTQVPESYGNAFLIRGHGLHPDRLGIGLYAGSYGHTFPILIYHFLYRLIVIK